MSGDTLLPVRQVDWFHSSDRRKYIPKIVRDLLVAVQWDTRLDTRFVVHCDGDTTIVAAFVHATDRLMMFTTRRGASGEAVVECVTQTARGMLIPAVTRPPSGWRVNRSVKPLSTASVVLEPVPADAALVYDAMWPDLK